MVDDCSIHSFHTSRMIRILQPRLWLCLQLSLPINSQVGFFLFQGRKWAHWWCIHEKWSLMVWKIVIYGDLCWFMVTYLLKMEKNHLVLPMNLTPPNFKSRVCAEVWRCGFCCNIPKLQSPDLLIHDVYFKVCHCSWSHHEADDSNPNLTVMQRVSKTQSHAILHANGRLRK